MPAVQASIGITDRYRDQLALLRVRVTTILGQSWAAVSLSDLPGTFRAWLAANQEVVRAAKETGALMSAGYLAAFLESELGKPVVTRSPGRDFSGSVQGDRSVGDALASSLVAVKVALSYQKPPDVALLAGLVRAQRIAAMEVAGTARSTLSEGMAFEDRVVGWRRVTSGNACGACLGAATGAIHETDSIPKVHGFCRCVAEPVVRNVRDRHPRPTGPEIFNSLSPGEQDALFHGTGGKQKADLVRSGAVSLADLVAPVAMVAVEDGITERPLADLLN